MSWKICDIIRSFLNERRGAALIYVSALLPVLIGGGLLVVDFGRLANLKTSLQSAADGLALAGAAELDRRPAFGGGLSSIDRATNAINNLLHNQSRFGSAGPTNVTASNIRFLSALPSSDATPIDASYETTDPREARYVEVTVTPTTMNTIFPATFLGAVSNSVTMSAVAVAGLDVAVCQFTPLYICNPYENDPNLTIYDAVADPAIRQREIILKMQGGTAAQNGPGNYGFLQPQTHPGADALRDELAQVSPPACFFQNGVEVETGSIASLRDAINVRFDLYEGALHSVKNNVAYRPARNVRKGYDPNGSGCNQQDMDGTGTPGYMKLPRDASFPYPASNPGRIGNADWDCQTYWDTNFSTPPVPAPAGCTSSPPTISRFQVYRYEIDQNLVSHPSSAMSPNTPETGVPQCYTGGTLNDAPDRRVLYGAIINCQQYADDLVGGSGVPIPVETFAKFFLVEPMTTPDQDMYVELTGLVDPGTDPGVVHDLVQLYR